VRTVGIATRMRNAMLSDDLLMETVVCDKCGQRFAIPRDPADLSAELIRKQTSWVEDCLVWDHIQERKHPGSIKLPKL
jgi:hypothetical protein